MATNYNHPKIPAPLIHTAMAARAGTTFPALLLLLVISAIAHGKMPTVQVFILAGQSNMEGAGKIEGDPKRNGGRGSLSHMADNNESKKLYAHLRDDKGSWFKRKDVMIWYLGRTGKLAPGFGARKSTIGPELGFGHVIGDALSAPVLLIKTAWGGKSLAKDFRPPSSGGETGPYYSESGIHMSSQYPFPVSNIDGLRIWTSHIPRPKFGPTFPKW